MNAPVHRLFDLLPAILRIRDLSQAKVTPGLLPREDRNTLADLETKVSGGAILTTAESEILEELHRRGLGGPLANLLAVFDEQIAILQEDLDQLYDDQFIETCADWVTPYIGDLIGYRALHGASPKIAGPRAEVAHTIAYRRRKGTISVIEQLARDVTGWNARAVEFFQQLVMTQYMNHRRLHSLASPDLRAWEPLARVGSAFNSIAHTVDVRRIASGRGRFNIPNVGVFLWRLDAYPLSGSPAVRVDNRRFRFHPLGVDQQLFTRVAAEDEITHLATPLNVPAPILRRSLATYFRDYYTDSDDITKSLRIYDDADGSLQAVAWDKICVCDLSDVGATWAHLPDDDKYAVDPKLGRIATPATAPADRIVYVDFHHGFSAGMGGGEYERAASFETEDTPPKTVVVPDEKETIADALVELAGEGVIEINDSGRYEETLAIAVNANQRVEIRAADRCRPTLILGDELKLSGDENSEIRLNGLLIAGHGICVPSTASNKLARLRISHCTLVPGLALAPDCKPQFADQASLIAETDGLQITIERAILGRLLVDPDATVSATDSIIDGTAAGAVAYAASDAADPPGPGGPLTLVACTVIGKVNAVAFDLVSNSILLAELADGDTWTAPVTAVRRQRGCVRFSYMPLSARVPRRYRCLPDATQPAELASPRFSTLRYGFPAYAQLAANAGASLLSGADDQGQPGAFHHLFQPQRETNLRVRLDEYLRAGLEAEIFYET